MRNDEYWSLLRERLLQYFDPGLDDLKPGRVYPMWGTCHLCDTQIRWRYQLFSTRGTMIEVGRDCIENYREAWDDLYHQSLRGAMLRVYEADDLDQCRELLRQPVTLWHVLVWCNYGTDEEIEGLLKDNSEETRQFANLAKPYIERANNDRLSILRNLEED